MAARSDRACCSITSPTGPITNKRTIESTVLVDDGGIVVLGGLLQDEYSGNQEKVPGPGDLPLFGRKKTNLMVFLRPVVLRDARATNNFSMDRYELMRAVQKDAQPLPSRTVQVNEAPVMPPQRAPEPSAGPAAPAQ